MSDGLPAVRPTKSMGLVLPQPRYVLAISKTDHRTTYLLKLWISKPVRMQGFTPEFIEVHCT